MKVTRPRGLTGLAVLLWLLTSVVAMVDAQSPTKDISTVFAEGRITGNVYENEYFGLTVTPANAKFTKGGFVSPSNTRAPLVDAQANAKNWDDKYSIAVLADAFAANPLVHSPNQHVRSVRHQFERQEGASTVQEESPTEISGLRFVRAIVKVTGQGRTHYRGIYSTFLNGYILSLDVEASTPERLEQIVLTMVKFKAPANVR